MLLLRKFLTLGLGASEAVVTGYRRPLGYQQILAATLAASTPLTLPTPLAGVIPGLAIIQVNGANVRWRDDGTAPTATVGMTLTDGSELDYVGDLTMIRFILVSGSPIIDVSYYV